LVPTCLNLGADRSETFGADRSDFFGADLSDLWYSPV
jgi:hypothetical protein